MAGEMNFNSDTYLQMCHRHWLQILFGEFTPYPHHTRITSSFPSSASELPKSPLLITCPRNPSWYFRINYKLKSWRTINKLRLQQEIHSTKGQIFSVSKTFVFRCVSFRQRFSLLLVCNDWLHFSSLQIGSNQSLINSTQPKYISGITDP